MNFRIFLFAWVFFGICSRAYPQDEIVEIDFQVISMSGTLRSLVYENGDGQRSPILAYETSRSFVYEYRGAPVLNLYEKDAVEEALPVASVDLAQAGKKNLMIVSEGSNGTYSVVLIRDDPDTHPLGSYRFFNTIGNLIAISANEDRYMVEPWSSKVVQGFEPGSDDIRCRIRVAIHDNDSWEMLYTNTWIGSASERYLVIIEKNAEGRAILKRIKG
ncbi:MAG: hypothetical protein ACPGN3_08690 [Opitutales bacterium]